MYSMIFQQDEIQKQINKISMIIQQLIHDETYKIFGN